MEEAEEAIKGVIEVEAVLKEKGVSVDDEEGAEEKIDVEAVAGGKPPKVRGEVMDSGFSIFPTVFGGSSLGGSGTSCETGSGSGSTSGSGSGSVLGDFSSSLAG